MDAQETSLPVPRDAGTDVVWSTFQPVSNFAELQRLLPGAARQLTRSALFAALMSIGFLNGVSEKVLNALDSQGMALAIFGTFGISAIVWIAAFMGIRLLLDTYAGPPASRTDLAVATVASTAILAPVPSLSWLAISGMAAHLLFTSRSPGPTRRAAAILLAMTIPVFWSRLLFAAGGNELLVADALIVGMLVGTGSEGNTVALADGSGWLFIAAGCSSITNVSIAILCSVLFVTSSAEGWTLRSMVVAGLACVATVLINVMRIALIGRDPSLYPIVHGQIGDTLTGWLTLIVIAMICTIGMRTHAPAAR
ncbi:MAG: hypothetical protein ACK4R3_00690 [Aliihoeflea sp.]